MQVFIYKDKQGVLERVKHEHNTFPNAIVKEFDSANLDIEGETIILYSVGNTPGIELRDFIEGTPKSKLQNHKHLIFVLDRESAKFLSTQMLFQCACD